MGLGKVRHDRRVKTWTYKHCEGIGLPREGPGTGHGSWFDLIEIWRLRGVMSAMLSMGNLIRVVK